MKQLLAIACAGIIVSYFMTMLVRWAARRLGFVDSPDGHHKYHEGDVALGGGLAVFLSVILTLAGSFYLIPEIRQYLSPTTGALVLAGAWMVLLGLYDDRYGMPGKYKLLGQILGVMILITSGLVIPGFVVFGFRVTLGALAIPFTMFWLLGAINSLNLLDGIDGLASTIGIILCIAIATMATTVSNPIRMDVALIATAVAAGLIGFLKYNFPPASMFLGDAGSMLIGLVVGTLSIEGAMKGTATVAMAAPIALWALPMFDSMAAIVRRKMTGRSIYATDRGHLHHRLMNKFGTNTRVLAVVAMCCAVTCIGALLSMLMHSDLLALAGVGIVVCILILTQAFGHVEFLMLASRAKSLSYNLLKPVRQNSARSEAFRLQGTREWNLLWQSVTEFAEKMQLVEARLDINLAAVQEGYHATWRRPTDTERREQWRTELPLISGGHAVGKLTVIGERKEGSTYCETIERLAEMLEPLEAEIIQLLESHGEVKLSENTTVGQPSSEGHALVKTATEML